MKKNERLDYLDFAKGIGMICVFIYHLFDSSMAINVWVRTFAVQLFFVISGMAIRYSETNKPNLKDWVVKKIKTLFIPYVFFCLMYDFTEGYQYGINELLNSLKSSLLLTPRGALWFLPTLFFSELILYILINKNINKKILFIFSMITFWLGMFLTKGWINQYTVLFVRICISFGYLTFGYLIFPLIQKTNIKLFLLLVIGYVFYLISLKNGVTSMFGCYFNNLYANFLITFSMCFIMLLISKRINNIYPINWIGKNSLIIMCTHQKILELFTSKIILGYPYTSLILGAINIIILLVVEFVIVVLINNYFPFVIGQKKKIRNI